MKRFFCILICMSFFATSFPAKAAELSGFYDEAADEEVTLIVEVEGDPVMLLADAKSRASIESAQSEVLKQQAEVMSAIQSEIVPEAEKGFVYTSVFNGFSMDARSSDIDEIKSLPGVKNVYISETFEVPELMMSEASELTHLNYSYEGGFRGEGQVIAVVDAFCDTAHEFFSTAPESPKYSKEDIDTILKNNKLNSGTESANQVYKSQKIPYAYSYVTKSSDTYSKTIVHGTHVAGIAVGKNGTMPDGSSFSGVAPEAQLMFMNIADANGAIDTDAIFAALNDAVILGADVINLSLGAAYVDYSSQPAWQTIVDNIREAGISVAAAAGNEKRGYNEVTPLTKNIDYGAGGVPQGVSAITSVASADNYTGDGDENAKAETAVKISNYSSWGVDSSLELKPEITTPGGNIYSSVPDNSYKYANGTSMASPHMAGMMALARQYYKTNPFIEAYNGFSGEKLVSLIENLAMNSAEIIRQESGVAYSPRLQGAGLASMENMMNSKVLLTGNSDKAKLSLGEISKNSFDISFDITNISTDDITFDEISVELMTDGYTELDGEYYVSDTVSLDFEVETENIMVKSGETKTFNTTVTIDENTLLENEKIFENGFFIDGFVILDTQNDSALASLPFTGFYGDWDSVPIFDSTIYDEGGSTLIDPDNKLLSGTQLRAYIDESSFYFIGRNNIDTSITDKKYISFSNTSGLTFAFSFQHLRAVSKQLFLFLDSETKQLKKGLRLSGVFSKYLPREWKFSSDIMSVLDEGSYIFRIQAMPAGGTEYSDTLELPFVIDNTSPEIVSVDYDETKKTVTVYAKDNHYISGIYAKGPANTIHMPVTDADISDDQTVKKTIDISAAGDGDIYIGVYDYAMNTVSSLMNIYTDKIGTKKNSINSIDSYTSASFTLRNNTEEIVKADVYIAFYDEDLRLIAAGISEDLVLDAGAEDSINYSMMANTQNAAYAKLFIWNANSYIPIDSAKNFNL